MHVSIPIPRDAGQSLHDAICRADRDAIRQLLAGCLDAAVEKLLTEREPPPLTPEEFDAILAEIDEIWNNSPDARLTPLPDEAIGREGLYEDHL